MNLIYQAPVHAGPSDGRDMVWNGHFSGQRRVIIDWPLITVRQYQAVIKLAWMYNEMWGADLIFLELKHNFLVTPTVDNGQWRENLDS